jgi:hypothetical protein
MWALLDMPLVPARVCWKRLKAVVNEAAMIELRHRVLEFVVLSGGRSIHIVLQKESELFDHGDF